MTTRRRPVRLFLEPLADRVVPAGNLTATFAAGTLTVVGDANANSVIVAADGVDATKFTLTTGGDTINGQAAAFTSPTGVKNLVFQMLGGDDTVTFDNTVPAAVKGSVTVNGGDGANMLFANDLTVGKNLSVTNGTADTGTIETFLTDTAVGGNVTVKNAAGDTNTRLVRSRSGLSTVRGNVTVTNGIGNDQFTLEDTDIDGGLTVNNGHEGAAGPGNFSIFNFYNSAFRSVVGKNVSVTFLDGTTAGLDDLFDLEVLGSVTLNNGSAGFTTRIDGDDTHLPVLIHGNLSILGTGANSVDIGTGIAFGTGDGLVLGKKFTLTSGGGTSEAVDLFHLRVGGDTSLTLNNGANQVTIDDSLFAGKFTLLSGAGPDTFNLETTQGTTTATEFKKAVKIDLGGGSDTSHIVRTASGAQSYDAGQAVVIWSTFSIPGVETSLQSGKNEFFPNGGVITF
jgi:hypothetical protein